MVKELFGLNRVEEAVRELNLFVVEEAVRVEADVGVNAMAVFAACPHRTIPKISKANFEESIPHHMPL